jgi:hypothetical protein
VPWARTLAHRSASTTRRAVNQPGSPGRPSIGSGFGTSTSLAIFASVRTDNRPLQVENPIRYAGFG